MHQRVSMIMNAAVDLATLRAFYETGLGWTPCGPDSALSVMYKVGHSLLVFLNADYLGKERGEAIGLNSRTSLAVFVESKNAVTEAFNRAIAAGAKQTSGLRDRDGGIYSGYFADPEGNSWEIVWSPHMPFDDEGNIALPVRISG
jgi:uncharacterized protein